VLAAPNGAEALALCEAEGGAIEVLLTDVVMPGLGGRELVEQVRLLRPGISVVLMSGYSETAGSIELDGRPVPFLDKPFSPAALLRVVHEALARREPVA
jgi:CheY-like chemotaxis protein